MLTTYYFSLPSVACISCIGPIEEALDQNKKRLRIDEFDVDIDTQTLTIIMEKGEHSEDAVFQSVHTLLDDRAIECVKESQLKNVLRRHWLWGGIGTGAGVALMLLSVFMNMLPSAVMIPVAVISVPLTLFLGAESYKETAKRLFKKSATHTMDALFAISSLTVITVSVAAFFFPWLPMMFDVGLLIFGFRHLGFAIEKSISQAIGSRTTFKDRLPSSVVKEMNESQQQTLLDEIKPEDILIVNPDDIIPVDGIALEDVTIIEADFTGDTDPHKLAAGEKLLAGMYLKGTQPIRMKATAASCDSSLALLDKSVARARRVKAEWETKTSEILKYFIPTVFALALISAVAVNYFFPPALAIQCAVAVLVSACPCTLGLITPLAVKIGMKKAAENGVHFKSAKKLQEAAKIDCVFFDLNGTLTSHSPVVTKHWFNPEKISHDELFAFSAVLEEGEQHSAAKAIYDYVINGKFIFSTDLNVERQAKSNRSGLAAVINGNHYTIGNQDMMLAADVNLQDVNDQLAKDKIITVGDSVIYLARANQVVGYFIINAPLRKDAIYVVNALKSSGKTVHLCTGADEATAARYAAALGITHIKACRAPSANVRKPIQKGDKQTDIEKLQAKGHRVAMIGDAGNDAVAVNASDFGIAVRSGRAIDALTQGEKDTQDKAGAVITDKSLLAVLNAFNVAEQTVANIEQNLLFSLVYNLGSMFIASGLLLGIGVMLNPSVGIALMILQTSLILYNTNRFKQQKLPHSQQTFELQDSPLDSYRLVKEKMVVPGVTPQPVPVGGDSFVGGRFGDRDGFLRSNKTSNYRGLTALSNDFMDTADKSCIFYTSTS